MTVKLLTEHHLEFLSLKGGCTGSSESTLSFIAFNLSDVVIIIGHKSCIGHKSQGQVFSQRRGPGDIKKHPK